MIKSVDKHEKRIGFDLDGVLVDHKKNRATEARRLGYVDVSENVSAKEVKLLMPTEDYGKVQNYMYGKGTIVADAMLNAQNVLKMLEKKSEFFIVSRRKPENRRYAIHWLEKYFSFPKKNIFFVNKDEEKKKVIEELGIEIYIDDKLSVLKTLPNEVKKFLFDELYLYKNKEFEGVTIVNSFDEFYKSF